MASCRHCGKQWEGHGVLCPECGLTVYDDMLMVFSDPPPDGLARVKYNRCLRSALKYLQEVAPQQQQQQPLEGQQRDPGQ